MRLLIPVVGLLAMTTSVFAGCEQLAVDTSRGTVRDSASGLTWSRCLLGQVSSGCLGEGASLSWVDALNRARGFELGGVSNWRLPKIEEFVQLFAIAPDCLAAAFPGSGASVAWSASANLDYATDSWAFDFVKGVAVVNARDSKLQVLLVASPNRVDSTTSEKVIPAENFRRDNIDITIRFDKGGYPGCRVDKLVAVPAGPFCSPGLMRGDHPLQTPEDFQFHTLMQDDTRYQGRPGSKLPG